MTSCIADPRLQTRRRQRQHCFSHSLRRLRTAATRRKTQSPTYPPARRRPCRTAVYSGVRSDVLDQHEAGRQRAGHAIRSACRRDHPRPVRLSAAVHGAQRRYSRIEVCVQSELDGGQGCVSTPLEHGRQQQKAEARGLVSSSANVLVLIRSRRSVDMLM